MAPPANSTHPPETSAVTSAEAAMICDACREHADIRTEQPPSTIKVHRDAGHEFDCNICLDGCQNPVVTHCGHLFCWPCLYSWLSLHSLSQECPVCKANVQDRIVPLYGSGGQAQHSINSAAMVFPNMEIPCRPSPSRSDVPLAATAVAHHEIHSRLGASPANVGFFASMLRYGMTPLTVHMRGGFFGEWGRSGAAILERRQWRFGNEKEFVLHWAFIFLASIAIVCFFVC